MAWDTVTEVTTPGKIARYKLEVAPAPKIQDSPRRRGDRGEDTLLVFSAISVSLR
jgi:hypothetical protein